MKKKVLLLGASGLIAPNLLEGLQPYYDLHLADVKAHPDGREIDQCDVSDYGQVLAAAEGMHAIMNFTVIRDDAERCFHVNTRGALNVMKAAVAHGIKKVIHSGPQFVRRTYDHDFDVADVPPVLGTGYYCLTKGLASEICRAYARAYDMQIISFVFNGLGPRPEAQVADADFPPFTVVCRLPLGPGNRRGARRLPGI